MTIFCDYFLIHMPSLSRKARQLYLYSTFHTRGRLKVLHIYTFSYNKIK